MGGWVRRLRGAIGMGLTWAAAWFAGTTFSVILGITERRRLLGTRSE